MQHSKGDFPCIFNVSVITRKDCKKYLWRHTKGRPLKPLNLLEGCESIAPENTF